MWCQWWWLVDCIDRPTTHTHKHYHLHNQTIVFFFWESSIHIESILSFFLSTFAIICLCIFYIDNIFLYYIIYMIKLYFLLLSVKLTWFWLFYSICLKCAKNWPRSIEGPDQLLCTKWLHSLACPPILCHFLPSLCEFLFYAWNNPSNLLQFGDITPKYKDILGFSKVNFIYKIQMDYLMDDNLSDIRYPCLGLWYHC